jgi:peptidoglycan/LPS O-acetylase OafA/YrhL
MAKLAKNMKIPALTGIRFFAASYVFVMHYGATFLDQEGVPRPIATLLHNGGFGVSIFFVLSGFILSHAHPGRFVTPAQYRDYFVARFARIYPVYLFALVLALPVAVASVPLTRGRAIAVLAMVQSWTDAYGHTGYAWVMQAWTLSVELFFYLLFPVAITALRRLGSAALVLLLLLDAAFMISGGTATVTPWIELDPAHTPVWPLPLFLPLVRSGEFLLGMVLHTLVSRRPAAMPRPGVAPSLATAATTLALLSLTRDPRLITTATLGAGALIALLYLSENAFTRLLGSPLLYVLGCASYALYLLQGPVHAYLRLFVPAPYDRILAFPATLAAALLVWRFIEEPARRAILALRPRAAAPMVVAAAPVREPEQVGGG